MALPRLAVIGVGLIGGSFALALKRAGAVGEVFGLDRSSASLEEALRLGLIDRACANICEVVQGTDIVLLATPVGQIPDLFASMAAALPATCVVTDVGSTKQDVVSAARAGLGGRVSQFVPAHPIAGREKSGVAAADASLYQHRHVVLTPLAENSAEDVERISAMWRACGAKVSSMAPASHDAVFAAVSHLPHMLAYALVDDLAGRDNAEELFSFAAGGFRDFTRIASSSPEMWRDIALNNREALLGEIDAFGRHLDHLRALIAAGDGVGIAQLMANARDRRDAWLSEFNAGTGNTSE